MSRVGSVTIWLNRLKAGESRDTAVSHLWERYFAELVHRASRIPEGTEDARRCGGHRGLGVRVFRPVR